MAAKRCCLVREAHIPARARFPVIDAHNHLWAAWEKVGNVVAVMDAVGVVSYCDLTANLSLVWADGGYDYQPAELEDFYGNAAEKYPGRFYGFTTATFTPPRDRPLFDDIGCFVEETLDVMNDHVERGARGLKILKELGLHYRDSRGALVRLDDEGLAPIWEEAGRLGIPVLMHQADPSAFFDPVTLENEHYESLKKYPSWSFCDPKFPRKTELLERRNRVIRRHPGTRFMLPHVANLAEDLGSVGRLLDENRNVYIDFSARLDELGRQPYSAREFMIKYSDRIYFGTDMPASVEMYRCYFRFLETYDEAFIPPDYDGTFDRFRWAICGVGLPDDVLKKIYYENVSRIVPGMS